MITNKLQNSPKGLKRKRVALGLLQLSPTQRNRVPRFQKKEGKEVEYSVQRWSSHFDASSLKSLTVLSKSDVQLHEGCEPNAPDRKVKD